MFRCIVAVHALAVTVGCGPQRQQESPRAHEATGTSTEDGFQKWLQNLDNLQEAMHEWPLVPLETTAPCAWSGLWRALGGPPQDYLLTSSSGVIVYGMQLLVSEVAVIQGNPAKLRIKSIWPVIAEFSTQNILQGFSRRTVEFVPDRVWVEPNGSVDVLSREGDQVMVGWQGAPPVAIACSELQLDFLQQKHNALERRVDGYLSTFNLHDSPEGAVVFSKKAQSGLLNSTTAAVTILEREGAWVHVQDASSVYHHFDGWVKSEVLQSQPHYSMWGQFHSLVAPTHRTTQTTQLYDPKNRASLEIEVVAGLPVALRGLGDAEFVSVALPGIIAKEPEVFYVRRDVLTEN